MTTTAAAQPATDSIPADPSERTVEQQQHLDSLSCKHGRTWYWAHQTGCC